MGYLLGLFTYIILGVGFELEMSWKCAFFLILGAVIEQVASYLLPCLFFGLPLMRHPAFHLLLLCNSAKGFEIYLCADVLPPRMVGIE